MLLSKSINNLSDLDRKIMLTLCNSIGQSSGDLMLPEGNRHNA